MAATKNHDYHILPPDPWPLIGAFSALSLFGGLVEGQEVVKAILAAPVSPIKGEGSMKGQMLEPAVKIVKAERVKD